jgi:hypothetical protein
MNRQEIRRFLEKIIPLSRWRERVGERVEKRLTAAGYPLSLTLSPKGARELMGIFFAGNHLRFPLWCSPLRFFRFMRLPLQANHQETENDRVSLADAARNVINL